MHDDVGYLKKKPAIVIKIALFFLQQVVDNQLPWRRCLIGDFPQIVTTWIQNCY